MTAKTSPVADPAAADRRGDDTHWWKAYQLHSTVTSGVLAAGRALSAGKSALTFASREPFHLMETAIHRAAYQAVQSKSVDADRPSD